MGKGIVFQKLNNSWKLLPEGTISTSPETSQACAVIFPLASFAIPREIRELIFLRRSMHFPASELTRHLFFHGETLPALSIAILIS